jgi:uncharacterized coiled-coil DUF342 family protein
MGDQDTIKELTEKRDKLQREIKELRASIAELDRDEKNVG